MGRKPLGVAPMTRTEIQERYRRGREMRAARLEAAIRAALAHTRMADARPILVAALEKDSANTVNGESRP